VKLAVLGIGNVGLAFLKALKEDGVSVELRLCDISKQRLEAAEGVVGRAEVVQSDLSSDEGVLRCVDGVDLVVDALPSRLSPRVLELCASRCIDVLSISFISVDPFRYHEPFAACGRKLVVDAGIAPGLSNIMVARIASILDDVEEVGIYVGGLPAKPVEPLGYVITWSAEDLIEEYTRRARIVKNGRVVEVDPLESVENVEIPGLGVFEAFYSDGLRTMLKTLVGKIRNMYEKTLRWPGHLEKIRLLRDLGFFDTQPIEIGNVSIPPRIFTARILEKRLRASVEDVVIMQIVGRGRRGGEEREITYRVIVEYDRGRGLSAMSKATGFTAYAIFREVFLKNRVVEPGLVPPEALGFIEDAFRDVISYLKSRDVVITELWK